MTNKIQLHNKIAAELRNQEYGYKSQPSVTGMTNAIVNAVFSDVLDVETKIAAAIGIIDGSAILPVDDVLPLLRNLLAPRQ